MSFNTDNMNGVLPYWLAKRICNEWPRVHGAAFVPADLGPCDALILDPPPARGSMRVFDASPPHTWDQKNHPTSIGWIALAVPIWRLLWSPICALFPICFAHLTSRVMDPVGTGVRCAAAK